MRRSVKYLILFFGLLETFVFTGNILGWTGLLYMLKSEGIYAYLCDDNSMPTEWTNTTKVKSISSIEIGNFSDFSGNYGLVANNWTLKVSSRNCDDQDRLLNLAFTIGSFCLGSTAFIWGFLLENWGLRYVRLVINGLLTVGAILLSLTKQETSYLIFPSLILMCLAGVPLRLANMQIADLFPERRSTIITLYSGAFGASASIFVLIKYGYDAGLPWEWACFILVVLSVLMLPVTLFLLPFYRIEEPVENKKRISFKTRVHGEVAGITPSVWGSYVLVEDTGYFESNLPTICVKSSMDAEKKSMSSSMNSCSSNGRSTTELASKQAATEIPLRSSVMSMSYVMHQYWFCWLLLLTIIYVGTLHVWSSRSFASEEGGTFFAELYGLFQVSGLFLAPIGGLFMDWSIRRASKEPDPDVRRLNILQSNFWPITLTSSMAVIVQGAKYFDNGTAIWISVIFVTLLRTCLLSIGTAYLRIRFPAEHFGRLLGIMSTMSAIFTLLQFPLFIWETSSVASVLQVHIFDTVCLILACVHPILLLVTPLQRRYIRKEKTLEQQHSIQCKNNRF